MLCNVKLPDGSGIELSRKIKEKYPWLEIILLTAYGNIPDGVQAIKNGSFDYITKGDDNNKIIPLVSRALEKVTLAKRVRHLENQLSDKVSFERILGKSKEIQMAIELARKVAPTDATVLLTGESKTKKVNVRLIAATNRNLNEQIKSGLFRADLFYRISAFQITLPSLRERADDIEQFVRHFAQVYAFKLNKKLPGISPAFF